MASANLLWVQKAVRYSVQAATLASQKYPLYRGPQPPDDVKVGSLWADDKGILHQQQAPGVWIGVNNA